MSRRKKILKSEKFDYIFLSNFNSPTVLLAVSYLKRHKMPYVIESDGGFHKSGKGIKEKIKRWIISGAKLCFSTGKSCDEYFIFYGAKKESIVRYPLTSLYKKDILDCPLSREEKEKLKKEYGFNESKIIVSAGQFIESKGFDLLVLAIKNLFNKKKEYKVLYVALFIMVIIGMVIFAWGTANAGTAIRHRDKMLVEFILLYALYTKKDKGNLNKDERN